MPLALTDAQLGRLMAAATALDDPGKRHTLLKRVVATCGAMAANRPAIMTSIRPWQRHSVA